jgi:DNA (cytosine-5)-methyltransferase 1
MSKTSKKRPKVIDLFAGAGGFSEGFIRAGFDVVSHVEMDKNACLTLQTRMIYHALNDLGRLDKYKEYVLGQTSLLEIVNEFNLQKEFNSVISSEINDENYKDVIRSVKAISGESQIDIIIGGPPCQAYSYVGRARDKAGMKNDKRNLLYKHYIAFLKAFKPKMFVFENVPGLLTAGGGQYLKDMKNEMKKAGYDTDHRVLNAADFGVPQNRKRVILIGWSKSCNLTSYPDFEHYKQKNGFTVADYFKDLPKIKNGGGKKILIRKPSESQALKTTHVINKSFDIVMDHVSRPNIGRDLEIYKLAVEAKKQGKNLKYNELPNRLKNHKNQSSFLDRYKVVDGKSNASHTVVAHICKDGHFYIHPDPLQNRSLSVREAARLQTFPDDFKFEGERGPQFKQIGNAVPPYLAEVIANELKNYL